MHERTRSLACSEESTQASHHRYAETIRHSLHDGFTAYDALSSVSGLFSHRRLKVITRDLIPASGDQDHASLPYASAALVWRCLRIHRIPHHVS
ncbi:MAG TPA: hypothetical protein VFR54_05015 [Xanthobacteraceae bacterium]|nr:hypothetical protein [Xanthobacteraceae bacterium]